MAGEVNVNITSLERLSASLAETLPMLDRLQAENEASFKQAQRKIEIIQNEYFLRTDNAADKHAQAVAELQYAENNYEEVPDFYYRAVAEAEAEYWRLKQCCKKIEEIKNECENKAIQNKQAIADDVETYTAIIKKSDTFLSQFSGFIRSSQSALGNASIGNAKSSIGASTAGGNAQGLTSTQQTWKDNGDGTLTFNAPNETGQMLDSNQGKVAGFGGTCGLVSCVNVLRMSGANATEQQVVGFASSNGLCRTGSLNAGNNGGTSPEARQEVLAHYGIQSELRPGSIENIADAISEGRGVIASFDAGKLWDDPDYNGDYHAITITSVKKDTSGNILGFYVCDSGTGGKDNSKYYSASHIQQSLRPQRPINVTSVIR